MNALTTIAKNAYMARRHPDWKPGMQEDALLADVALRTLVVAAEIAAIELARANITETARNLMDAVAPFKDVPTDTTGVLKGNADLVPAQHTYLTAEPGDRS